MVIGKSEIPQQYKTGRTFLESEICNEKNVFYCAFVLASNDLEVTGPLPVK